MKNGILICKKSCSRTRSVKTNAVCMCVFALCVHVTFAGNDPSVSAEQSAVHQHSDVLAKLIADGLADSCSQVPAVAILPYLLLTYVHIER